MIPDATDIIAVVLTVFVLPLGGALLVHHHRSRAADAEMAEAFARTAEGGWSR